jgi:hypothetical protein
LVRSQFELTRPGRVKLRFNSIADLTLWIDGRRVEPEASSRDELTCDLAVGIHTLTLARPIEQTGSPESRRGAAIQCTLEDVAGSEARARVVLGK